MPKWFNYTAAFLLAPLLAGVSASAALSSVMASKLPDRAVQLPLADADAYANLAMEKVLSARAGDSGDDRRALKDLATRAFQSEPTNSRAVSLLALSRQLEGDREGARRLYANSLLLSPRERLANLSLIEDASQRGSIAVILARYDVLLRTGGATSDALFDVLTTAMREEAILPHLEELLASNPPWTSTFWLKAAPAEGAIENVGRLRLRMLARNIANPAGNDADIISRLVGQGHFDTAHQLFAKVSKQKASSSNLLLNGDFAKAPEFPPFDWATYSDARYGTEVDPVVGALVIFTESSADTLMARQLVRLPPGRYSLNVQVQDRESAKITPLTVRILCAVTEPTDQRVAAVAATGSTTIVDYAGGCEFSWVELWARKDAPPTTISTDVAIDSITLTPVRPASNARPQAN